MPIIGPVALSFLTPPDEWSSFAWGYIEVDDKTGLVQSVRITDSMPQADEPIPTFGQCRLLEPIPEKIRAFDPNLNTEAVCFGIKDFHLWRVYQTVYTRSIKTKRILGYAKQVEYYNIENSNGKWFKATSKEMAEKFSPVLFQEDDYLSIAAAKDVFSLQYEHISQHDYRLLSELANAPARYSSALCFELASIFLSFRNEDNLNEAIDILDNNFNFLIKNTYDCRIIFFNNHEKWGSCKDNRQTVIIDRILPNLCDLIINAKDFHNIIPHLSSLHTVHVLNTIKERLRTIVPEMLLNSDLRKDFKIFPILERLNILIDLQKNKLLPKFKIFVEGLYDVFSALESVRQFALGDKKDSYGDTDYDYEQRAPFEHNTDNILKLVSQTERREHQKVGGFKEGTFIYNHFG